MQRKTKKGFTIVELVIVIAVIGVLTAILVPTFISLTAKANKASDQSLVANLNTALKMQEAEDGEKNPTMHDAVKDLYDQGYRLEQLVSKSKEDLVYSLKENRFYLSGDSEVKDADATKQYEFWKIYKKAPALADQTFSIYAADGWTSTTAEVKVGFDAGDNKNIATVNYTNSNEQEVVIRTNGGTLIINATNPDSEQVHYGTLSSAEVTTGTSCFKTHGAIGTMDLKAGKAIADKGGYVGLIKAEEGTQVVEQNGGVFVIPSNATTADIPESVATQLSGYSVSEGAIVADATREAKSYYEIYNVETLLAYRDLINSGSQISVAKVTANIDMSSVDWVEMIGKDSDHKFTGKLDGQGYTISNLSNGDRFTTGTYTAPTSKTTGKIFGLFGYVTGIVNISNLNLTVDADIPEGKACGGLISNVVAGSTLNISGVTVSGNLYARNEKAAGFIGVTNGNSSVTITDCVNDINVKAAQRIAGFISQTAVGDSISFNNCQNKGKIELTKVDDDYEIGKYGVAAGFISHSNGADIDYDNLCSNSGAIEAPLAANFHTYVSSAITYNGNGTWKNANTDPAKMYVNISLKSTLGMVGVYETETSKAYFKLIESAWKIYNGFDGVFYHSDSAYSVFFYGDNRFESPNYCDIAAKYTADEWNAKIDAADSNIEHDSSSTMTIVLQRDLNWTADYQVGTSRTVIIDLNGHTLTATTSIIHGAGAGTKITFKNGTINAEGVSLVGDYYAEVNFVNITGSYIDQ